jgi:hypothetical protein
MFTRIVFLVCWLCQICLLIFLPLAFSVERRSSWAAIAGLLIATISVVGFIFIPAAMKYDLGDACFDASFPHSAQSPCTSLSQKEELFDSQVTLKWGPALGFYFAVASLGLIAMVFTIAVYLNPCTSIRIPLALKWLNSDISDAESVEDSQSFKENAPLVNDKEISRDRQASLSDHFLSDELEYSQ